MVIDNCSVIGDAAIQLDGLDVKVGATSTIPVVYMLAGLLAQTCENLLEQGASRRMSITTATWLMSGMM